MIIYFYNLYMYIVLNDTLYHFDLNIVKSYADLQSLPTHTSPAARAAAVAVAAAVALTLHGFPKKEILRSAASWPKVVTAMNPAVRRKRPCMSWRKSEWSSTPCSAWG